MTINPREVHKLIIEHKGLRTAGLHALLIVPLGILATLFCFSAPTNTFYRLLGWFNLATLNLAIYSYYKLYRNTFDTVMQLGWKMEMHGQEFIDGVNEFAINQLAKDARAFDANPDDRTAKRNYEFSEWYLMVVRFWTRKVREL